MIAQRKNTRIGTRRSFHIVLAAVLAWTGLSVHAGQDLELLPDQAELSVIVLPAIEGDDDLARGPRMAVRWSGRLPVWLQPGIEDAAGQWQADGEPIQLSEPMTLIPAPAKNAGEEVFKVYDEQGTVLASAEGESETFGWTPMFSGSGINDPVWVTTIYDGDLIVGGRFTRAGGETVNRIARWDGSQWSALSGPNGTGVNHWVRALTVHNGDLIAGGEFTRAGGETVNYIARWDGSEWSALSGPNGTGMNNQVWGLTVHNGDLIAGGFFTQAGGETVNYIARWDGSDWSAMSGLNGTGVNDGIRALTVHNGDLIAGGYFTHADGMQVNHIARWDGSQWSAFGGPNATGMNFFVYALTVHNGDLIAGGAFTQAGGETVNYIARWNGSEWSALSGPNDTGIGGTGLLQVRALTAHNGDLIAGGTFRKAGGNNVNHIARWDGNEWSALSGPNGIGMINTVDALAVHDGDLIAGGWLNHAGGVSSLHLAHWQLEATATEVVFVEHGAVDLGAPVWVMGRVLGPVSTPDGGLRGRIEADSGEFCQTDLTPAGSQTAVFACEITLNHPGIRTLTAHYSGSARYHPSQSTAVPIEVSWLTLEAEVSGQGTVTAGSAPPPVVGGIADCDEEAMGSSPCMAGYAQGDLVLLSIVPASGWFMDAMAIEGCNGVLAGTTYTTAPMTADCMVTVAFTTEHTLTYSAGPGGSLDGATSQTVHHGSSGTPVTAVPDAGFQFAQWSDGRTDNPRVDVDVIADVTVQAQWQLPSDVVFGNDFECVGGSPGCPVMGGGEAGL